MILLEMYRIMRLCLCLSWGNYSSYVVEIFYYMFICEICQHCRIMAKLKWIHIWNVLAIAIGGNDWIVLVLFAYWICYQHRINEGNTLGMWCLQCSKMKGSKKSFMGSFSRQTGVWSFPFVLFMASCSHRFMSDH